MFEELYLWVQTQLTTNDVFAGIIGGSAFASLLYSARSVPGRLWFLAKLQLTCELVVYNDDEAFDWLNEWLSAQEYARRARRLKVSTFYRGDEAETGSRQVWSLSPGPGNHVFLYRRRPMLVQRNMEESSGQGRQRRETLNFRILGRDQSVVRRIVLEAQAARAGGERVEIYSYTDYWRKVARKLPRSLDTVVLPDEQRDRILADSEWFFSAESWYRERGVPYRRGYLFHGVPGSGKSSLVAGLATHFKRPIYTLNLGSLYKDESVFDALSSVPSYAILLIEDVDAASASIRQSMKRKGPNQPRNADADTNDEAQENGGYGVSLSALLNAIDGVASTDGRLLVMTTNHVDALDPALIRCGRIDLTEEFGALGPTEVVKMFRRFFPEARQQAEAIEAEFSGSILPADLQEMLLRHRHSSDAAMRAVLSDSDKPRIAVAASSGRI